MFKCLRVMFVVTCEAFFPLLGPGQTTFNRPPILTIYSSIKYPVDTRVSFECYDGYSLDGPKFRTCQLSGHWDQSTSSCRKNGNIIYYPNLYIYSLEIQSQGFPSICM